MFKKNRRDDEKETRRRKHRHNEEINNWKIGELIEAFWFFMVLPFPRTIKHGIAIHPTLDPKFSLTHTIMDSIVIALEVGCIGYFSQWYAVAGILGVLTLSFMLGISRRIREHEKLKTLPQETETENKKEDYSDIAKLYHEKTNTTYEAKEIKPEFVTAVSYTPIESIQPIPDRVPEYDNTELEKWHDFFESNKGTQIRAGRK